MTAMGFWVFGSSSLLYLWQALYCALKSAFACTENLMGHARSHRGQSGFLLATISTRYKCPAVPASCTR